MNDGPNDDENVAGPSRRYLDTNEAAEVSRLSASWLIKLRNYHPEKSPPFLKFGKRVLYPADDLHAWMLAHLANGSTND